jgi:hypothetical protein
MANVDIFSSGINVPFKSEIPNLSGFDSMNPLLDFSNYSNLIPGDQQTPELNFEPGPFDMFPSEIPENVPQQDGLMPTDFEPMFPSEIPEGTEEQPLTFPGAEPGLGEEMFPSEIPEGQMPEGFQSPLDSLNVDNILSDETERDFLLNFLKNNQNMDDTSKQLIQQQISQLSTQISEQQTTLKQMSYNAKTVKNSAVPVIMNRETPISASSGYEIDIRNFFQEIKNPPMWRVLD